MACRPHGRAFRGAPCRLNPSKKGDQVTAALFNFRPTTSKQWIDAMLNTQETDPPQLRLCRRRSLSRVARAPSLAIVSTKNEPRCRDYGTGAKGT